MNCVYMLFTGTYNNYVIYDQPLIKTITSDQFASTYDLFCFFELWFFWRWIWCCFVYWLGILEAWARGDEPLMTLGVDTALYCHKSSYTNTPLHTGKSSRLLLPKYYIPLMYLRNKLIFVLMGILSRPGPQLNSDDRDTKLYNDYYCHL